MIAEIDRAELSDADLDRMIARQEARLEKLQRLAALEEKTRQLVAVRFVGEPPAEAILRVIAQEVAAARGVRLDALDSRQRSEDVAWARFLVWYIAQQIAQASDPGLGMTLERMGDFFHRDHGSVCYGMKAVRSRLSVDATLQQQVATTSTNCLARFRTLGIIKADDAVAV